jgi:hypothetical protein
MRNGRGSFEQQGLTISYKELGTISIDELMHALIEDIHALKDLYNVQYVKAPRLRFFVTNEYGEIIPVRRPGGGTISFMDTHHYRPACRDYDL